MGKVLVKPFGSWNMEENVMSFVERLRRLLLAQSRGDGETSWNMGRW
jgi:hypothetical protein